METTLCLLDGRIRDVNEKIKRLQLKSVSLEKKKHRELIKLERIKFAEKYNIDYSEETKKAYLVRYLDKTEWVERPMIGLNPFAYEELCNTYGCVFHYPFDGETISDLKIFRLKCDYYPTLCLPCLEYLENTLGYMSEEFHQPGFRRDDEAILDISGEEKK